LFVLHKGIHKWSTFHSSGHTTSLQSCHCSDIVCILAVVEFIINHVASVGFFNLLPVNLFNGYGRIALGLKKGNDRTALGLKKGIPTNISCIWRGWIFIKHSYTFLLTDLWLIIILVDVDKNDFFIRTIIVMLIYMSIYKSILNRKILLLSLL
jgi:hypothetical protein